MWPSLLLVAVIVYERW